MNPLYLLAMHNLEPSCATLWSGKGLASQRVAYLNSVARNRRVFTSSFAPFLKTTFHAVSERSTETLSHSTFACPVLYSNRDHASSINVRDPTNTEPPEVTPEYYQWALPSGILTCCGWRFQVLYLDVSSMSWGVTPFNVNVTESPYDDSARYS
jgi:hypothetical protein